MCSHALQKVVVLSWWKLVACVVCGEDVHLFLVLQYVSRILSVADPPASTFTRHAISADLVTCSSCIPLFVFYAAMLSDWYCI